MGRRHWAGPWTIMCLLGVLAVATLPANAASPSGVLEALRSDLKTIVIHSPGDVAIDMRALNSMEGASIGSNKSMPAASTIKIPVMVEIFRQLSVGRFDLNTRVPLHRQDKDWGSGSLAAARNGTKFSITQLLEAMITASDNTATNMLIRIVGASHVNTTMHRLGLRSTYLPGYIRTQSPQIRNFKTSPADMVRLLTFMAKDELVDEWSSEEMLQILSRQKHNGLLPEPLPLGMRIAHKTGTLHDTLNDVGIVYLKNDPYVIAVMTTHLPSLSIGRRFIRRVSKVAYNAFSELFDFDSALSPGASLVLPASPAAPTTDTPMWGSVPLGSPTPAPN